MHEAEGREEVMARQRHAERLAKQEEELRRARKEDEVEDDWFRDRSERYLEDFLPPEFDQFVPPDVRQRFVAAQREALIGFRALIDYWLDRSGGVTTKRRPRRWEHHSPKEPPK
jgi:hypothetical protein